MNVCESAQLLGKTAMWVRYGLRTGALPIGAAVQMPGGKWVYDIRPERLAAYMGITMDELLERKGDAKV